ncbi:MAG: hypothetical protein ABR920_15590 [Terriglobales bacterium]
MQYTENAQQNDGTAYPEIASLGWLQQNGKSKDKECQAISKEQDHEMFDDETAQPAHVNPLSFAGMSAHTKDIGKRTDVLDWAIFPFQSCTGVMVICSRWRLPSFRPHPSFFEGRDCTVVSRLGFLADS